MDSWPPSAADGGPRALQESGGVVWAAAQRALLWPSLWRVHVWPLSLCWAETLETSRPIAKFPMDLIAEIAKGKRA